MTRRILSKLQILKQTVSSTGAARLSSSRSALFIEGVYDNNVNMYSLKVPFLPLIPICARSQVKWSLLLSFQSQMILFLLHYYIYTEMCRLIQYAEKV